MNKLNKKVKILIVSVATVLLIAAITLTGVLIYRNSDKRGAHQSAQNEFAAADSGTVTRTMPGEADGSGDNSSVPGSDSSNGTASDGTASDGFSDRSETAGGTASSDATDAQPGQSSSDNPNNNQKQQNGLQHVDADGNGKCDACGAKMSVEVDFYVINDLHGKFDDSYGQPGVDELTTYLRERTVTDEHAIFLSSGDMWQGSSESNQTEGGVIIDWMNELGFVSMTLGNHEFDWGEEVIAENAGKAQFPFLAINIYGVDTLEQVPYCRSSVMVEAGDLKLGIIGAIGDCYSSISAVQSGGFYIITGDELTELVKDEALKLRAEGADFIIYSIHDGYSDSFYSGSSDFNDRVKVLADARLASYYDTALSGDYVDLVFEGHTHQNYVVMDTKGVYHLQDGGENDGISHVQVEFEHGDALTDSSTANAGSVADSGIYTHECSMTEIVLTDYYAKRGSDSLRDEILERYADELAFTKEVLGTNDTYLDRDDLRRLVAQLYYETGAEKWGDEYDLVLGGGFLSVRDPRHLDPGDVTYADLQALFPFDNELVLCSCSGYDLKRVFFNSMNSNYFIYYSELGEALRSGDEPVDLNGTYYVIVDTYSSTYEPNNLTEVEHYGEELYARDLLAEWFRE